MPRQRRQWIKVITAGCLRTSSAEIKIFKEILLFTRETVVLLPQPKSAAKGIVVVSGTTVRRQRLQLTDVAPSEHCVFGFQRRDKAGHDVSNVAPPFLLAAAVQSRFPDLVLVGALFVRQVTKLHGHNNAVDNHGRSESGSEAEKKHFATLVTSHGLHGGVVDDHHWTREGLTKTEPDPPMA